MLKDYIQPLRQGKMPARKRLEKKGTLAIGIVESTPVVWKGQLLRLESFGNLHKLGEYPPEKAHCAHFVDMETGRTTPRFAFENVYCSCYTENGKMYVYGTDESDPNAEGKAIHVFTSDDLINWEKTTALPFPLEGMRAFNTSVCKGPDCYIMAIEIGGTHPLVGEPFTIVFAQSRDLIHWEMLPMEDCAYDRDRYTACPVIRYHDGFYYMIYLEGAPAYRWIPYIVRTADFREFELGLTNPIMFPSHEDKKVIRPERYSQEQLAYLANGINSNNSDIDMCEHNGKTVIVYCWGNQLSAQNLALAEYDGPEEEFLKSFFP